MPGAMLRGLMVLLMAAGQLCYAQATQAAPDAAMSGVAKTPEVVPATYKIGMGDVLHITVWEEPQLTETAVVRPDGKVSMPLVTEVDVAGLTPEAAQQVLTERLVKFVHKPRVTVTVQEIHSRMVYITGEVQRPGAYPLMDAMNVVQLVARAGGLTDFAKQKQVYVLRGGTSARLNVNYEKVLKGQAPQQNVELAPGDTVVVP
ncbi:polysaccharide biosynthesis/export family protein [Alloacidobacterium dinghuense]|uniref:Polysaccharide biosynthesis/export family protein n=1 Tax=Alloacidobacterium dinghuense TaxID=2763107 RepID=A0A7G8BLJ1_9BACT|nr:polysaccharide biosynthesis/export family protein [Alloacidobacterium dinghuense]QNI33411.1 polysaccharide biosynthesis/export family protein [Alloacidobacterium dinghuense]